MLVFVGSRVCSLLQVVGVACAHEPSVPTGFTIYWQKSVECCRNSREMAFIHAIISGNHRSARFSLIIRLLRLLAGSRGLPGNRNKRAIFAGNTLSCMRSNEMYGFQPPSPPILARLAVEPQVDGLGRFRLGWRARKNPYSITLCRVGGKSIAFSPSSWAFTY